MPDASELEALRYATQLNEQHTLHLYQTLVTGGPAAVMRELAGTGLSHGALQYYAAALDQHGFHGAVQHVQGRLQQAALANQAAEAAAATDTVKAAIADMTPEQLAQEAQNPEMQKAAAVFLESRGLKIANGETAFDKVVSMYRPAPKPADDSSKAHLEAAWEKLVKEPPTRPASDIEKQMRGQDLKPGTRAVVGDSTRYHLEQSQRRLSGESMDGIEVPPRLRAERLRTTAADLREKAHEGDSTRDHLARSYERLEASQKGDAALAQHEATRSSTLEAARNLESYASATERDDQ